MGLLGLGNSANDINNSKTLSSTEENQNNIVLVSSAVFLVLYILYIPASICLIVGALKDNRKLVAVFLVVDGINIVLIFLKTLILFCIYGFFLGVLIISLIAVAFTIFIWLFPYSLYQTLQDSSPSGGQVHYPAQTQSYSPPSPPPCPWPTLIRDKHRKLHRLINLIRRRTNLINLIHNRTKRINLIPKNTKSNFIYFAKNYN